MLLRLCLPLAACLFWSGAQAVSPQPPSPPPSPTLQAVQKHKKLACGVVTEAQDWNKDDLHGNLSPLGVEICRAMAVAMLGHAEAAEISYLPAEAEALRALRAGQVDVVVGLTPTISTAVLSAVTFGPAVFWDSQGFMVHKALGVSDAAGLAGKPVCYIDGTDNDAILRTALQARSIKIIPFPFQEEGEMDAGLIGGHCRAVSAMISKLAEVRTEFHAMVHDFVLLPDRLAVLPAAIATRQDDAVWSNIAAATVDALIQADMLGITRARLASFQQSEDPVVQHLLGANWSAGQALGLARDWSAQMLAVSGNYAEIYQRSVGPGSHLDLPVGLNADCLHGGLICAPPLR